jgi:uncharacterized membrane protein YfhO
MTTIPYDKGWQVYVDGEQVETFEVLDALVAFRVDDAGEHTIRFVYRSSAFKVGIIITIVSIAGFVLIIIFERRLRKIKLVKNFFVVEDNSVDDSKLNYPRSKTHNKGK